MHHLDDVFYLFILISSRTERSFTFKFVIVYRGGVLEPEGTVIVQFKQKDIVQTMKRIDPKYKVGWLHYTFRYLCLFTLL